MAVMFASSRPSAFIVRTALATALALSASVDGYAQVAKAGRNVNMASGTTLPDGDPFLQRQGEVSVACSSRDPLTCVAMANDYRTVDEPGLSGGRVIGDAWLGAFFTVDGGETWRTKLVPGYPQDPSTTSPLKGYEAAADPTVRTGTNGMFYATGIAFNRSAVPGNVPPAAGAKARAPQPPNMFARAARAVLGLFVDDKTITSWFGRVGAAAPPQQPSGHSGVVFITRYIDDNNVDNGTPDKVAYLNTSVIETGKTNEFIDKPSLAVDIPRSGASLCTIPAHDATPVQSFPGGTLHVAFTVAASSLKKTDLMYTQSTNCGVSWTKPQSLDQRTRINQGAAIAIDPRTGAVNIFWRVFEGKVDTDGIYMARSIDGGAKFSKPSLAMQFPAAHRPFDQSTLPDDTITTHRAFRTNALPTAITDQFSRTYLAVSQRGWAPGPPEVPAAERDARIVMVSTVCSGPTCTPFTTPEPVDNHPARGHQFMPSLTLTAGKLAVGWQDNRDSFGPKLTTGGEGFGQVIADPVTLTPYHTVDVRIAFATPGAAPVFTDNTLDGEGHPVKASTRVSRYLFGFNPQQPNDVRQIEFNPSNYPLYTDGTRPFIGDYIDVSPTVPFVRSANGEWSYNLGADTLPEPSPLPPQVITTWGDNRDVRPPADGNWTNYTPPNTVYSNVQCIPGQEGMRNQNPYSATVSEGIVLTSPGIAKPVNAIQRAFSVALENATDQKRTFTLQIMTQPPAPGKASFLQFPTSGFDDPLQTLTLNIPARSTASRSVFVTSPPGQAFVPITVRAQDESGTLHSELVLNNDAATNPLPVDAGLLTAESYDPIISRTVVRVLSPDFLNPDFLNPDFLNPDFLNPDFLNPDFLNPDFLNPDFLNPDFLNPDFLNPDFLNPDFLNATAAGDKVTSVEWTVTNTGNTTASYAFRPVLQITPEEADKFAFLLFVSRIYQTPVVENCQIVLRTHEQTLAIVPNPDFLNPDFLNPDFLNPDFLNPDFLNPDFLNPDFLNSPLSESAGNTTLTIAPRSTLKVTLLVRHDGTFDGEVATSTTAAVLSQGVDTETATTACVDGDPATRCGPEPVTIVPLTIAFEPLTTGVATFPYSESISAVGGQQPYAWSASGLPAGLSINPTTGAISGTPTVFGNFDVVVTVTDSTGPAPFADDQQYALAIVDPLAAAVVTNTASTGPGSLRAAIDLTNTTPASLIIFDIPGAGVHKILPQTPLPTITKPVSIDATTQPGYAGTPLIEIDGSAVGLPSSGLTITAGSSVVRGLIINRFAVDGIVLQTGGGNVIARNYIGTNAAGTAPAGNGGNAITIVDSPVNTIGGVTGTTPGGSCTGDCNLLVAQSTSSRSAIAIDGVASTGNRIFGNFMGVDVTGTVGLAGNSDFAMTITNGNGTAIGDGSPAGRNVVGGNNTGIAVSASTVAIRGNYIGINTLGTAAITHGFGGYNQVNGGLVVAGGSASTVEGNVVSGNDGWGVLISGAGASGNFVRGNYIGVNAAGTAAVGNGSHGVLLFNQSNNNIIGGATAADRNVISGNGQAGVSLGSDSAIAANRVWGNYIGTNAAGTGPIPNVAAGVLIDLAVGNSIGGPVAGQGNLIAYNGGPGVSILPGAAVDNTIAGNSMFANAGLGIDLNGDGVTLNDPNDVDGGANRQQNYPVLTNATPTLVQGNINSTPGASFNVQFFSSATCDASGSGEGDIYLGQLSVPTDSSGNSATFAFAPSGALALGSFVTATATTATGSTSEFSQCQQVTAGAPGFVVTNTSDSGAGSLRQAITDAEATPGHDTITFNIPGPGPHTISVGTFPLPPITPGGGPATIDGTTQPGYVGEPLVELDGAAVGVLTSSGLTISAGGSTVTGLAINRFPDSAIRLSLNGSNTIVGNWIGLALDGLTPRGNLNAGIGAEGTSHNNIIGGTSAGARNVISGNNNGVLLWGGTGNNLVHGNYIGTNKAGTGAVPNTFGVRLEGTSANFIGGTTTAARNVISGNTGAGILVDGTTTYVTYNSIIGNYVGVNAAGTGALPNGVGIRLEANGATFNTIGGSAAGTRNVISGNNGEGIVFLSSARENTVQGNYIGTSVDGTSDLGNRTSGIVINGGERNVIGGLLPGEGNIISGNGGPATGHGVEMVSSTGTAFENRVEGNRIGTNVAGTASLPNTGNGVSISNGSNNVIRANLISGNAGGIRLAGATTSTVAANFIGTNAAGTAALGNSGSPGVSLDLGASSNTIGGTTAADRNIISGNSLGIRISGANSNTVSANYIGLNNAGTAALSNGDGIDIDSTSSSNVIGGSTAGERNVISGNFSNGIRITGTGTSGNIIKGNYVGTNAAGTVGLGGTHTGVFVTGGATSTVIGGTAAGDGNVISGNQFGVRIESDATTIQGNLIGTDPTGTVAVGNEFQGVRLETGSTGTTLGGTSAAARNIISGNGYGARIEGTDNLVQGNYIGPDVAGESAPGTQCLGLEMSGGSNNIVGGSTAAARNVISGNAGCQAVYLSGTASPSTNYFRGNYIGVSASGAAMGNGGVGVFVLGSNFVIGGTVAGEGNVISNNTVGIETNSSDTLTIEGNFIGTDPTGTAAMGNTSYGISLLSGHDIIIGLPDGSSNIRNTISGNGATGVLIDGVTNVDLNRNRIGTTANGGSALGNTGHGIFITGLTSNVRIGGTISDDSNRIASNGFVGIVVAANGAGAPSGVNVTFNDIYSNGGLGIDLGGAGVNANDVGDGDTGPNGLQNFPVISGAVAGNPGSFTVSLNSTASTSFTIRVFVNSSCNAGAPNDYGEGELLVAAQNLTTNAAGNGSTGFGFTLASGTILTATATGPGGTSEFSQCVVVP